MTTLPLLLSLSILLGWTGMAASQVKTYRISVTNLAYKQPLSPFFVLVHNWDAEPIFTLGKAPSAALALLANSGQPTLLVDWYTHNATAGVYNATAASNGKTPPFTSAGEVMEIEVQSTAKYPLVSIVSMAVNTNDCFIGFIGLTLKHGLVVTGPGYDAGSEYNDELCTSVPGSACALQGTLNGGRGEGLVLVHRGIHGVGNLDWSVYDWRNPMVRVRIDQLS